MHDFHLADMIYRAIMDYAQKNSWQKVKSVTIELGSIVEHGEEILPANLAFNLKLLAEGGIAEGLEVKILKISGGDWILKEVDAE